MSLIDRQAAIDAVQEELNKQEHSRLVNIWTTAEVRFTIVDLILKQLPSEEPTQKNYSNTLDALDCVSRQGAIEAIEHHEKAILGEHNYTEGIAYGYAAAHRHLVDIVKLLPSAQPEIIRCKDCKHWTDENSGFCDIWDHYISNDKFFCGCGERRENDGIN